MKSGSPSSNAETGRTEGKRDPVPVRPIGVTDSLTAGAALGQVAGYRYAPFSTGLPPEVAELARAGKTLEAVKLYRQLTNANFEQAKLAVQKATAGSI